MKEFRDQFKDRVDCSDGSVVLREPEYKQIQEEAIREGMRRAVGIVELEESKIYVGHNPIREGIKRGLSNAQIAILSYMTGGKR